MADKTVIVKIEYDTISAVKSANELTAAIEGEKIAQSKLKQELEDGKISQKDYSVEVEKSKIRLSESNKERKATLNLLASEKGSINELKANIKKLTIERDNLDRNTKEGRKAFQQYNITIDKLNESLKKAQNDTGKTSGAFATFGNNLKSLPGPLGGVINGIGGMTKAALAFIATPIGAVIAAVGLALKALISYFKGSEEGQNRLNKIVNIGKAIFEALMDVVEKVGEVIFNAISKPQETIQKLGELIKENLINRFQAFGVMGKAIVKIFKGDFKEGFKQLAEGGIQATTGITNAFDKMKNAVNAVKNEINNLNDNIKKKTDQAKKLSDIQAEIDKRERKMIVEREKVRVEADELLLQSKRKDLNFESERLNMLTKASKLIDGLATSEEQLAIKRLQAAKLRLSIEGDTKEALTEVAQAEADVISKKAEGLEARRRIESQISELNIKAQKDIKETRNVTVETNTIINESDKQTQEDIAARRGQAIFELAELKRQEQMIEEENFAKLRDLQIANENAKWEYEKSNTELLNEEREVLEQEHKMRLAEIEQAYLDQIAEKRSADLKDALDSMNVIINAAQGMADKRVSISSAAFAKIATINYKEVKSASDAFVAIGTAAQGLTELVVANHERELSDLEAKKQVELALVGDNKESQDAINKKYAKKEQDLKKKQFEDDKKKALIDAAIATAIAVVKGLASGLPMPGLLMAALAAVMGGIQIAAISKQKYNPSATYAEGGAIIGGKPHSIGGTKFYGEDGSSFEAEKGEGLFVLKKDATAEIAALSMLNESFGGRSWTGQTHKHLAEGGEAQTGNIEKTIDEAILRTPIFVRVGDIQTGMTEVNKSKNVGVI